MKVRRHWVLWLVFPIANINAFATPGSNSGGSDVSVALFSTRTLHTVTLTPLGLHSWVARCAQCAQQPLTAPLHMSASTEVFAGGTLRIADDSSGETRTATGLWHLRASGPQHEIDVVLTLPSERYVAAVLNAEAAKDEPPQSLRALAILARTYALNGGHYTLQPGHLQAELCDSTACQAMLFTPIPQAIDAAVQSTAGETLWSGTDRAEVFFSQSCGGLTEDAGALWPSLRDKPYLRSHADPYCVRRDTAAWHAEVPLTTFADITRAEGWRIPANIVTAHITERSASHRALRVAFAGRDNTTSTVSASALRFGIGRALGWNRVRSDAYDLGVRNSALVFDGHGHGHGVGLCQEGATEMASEGKSVREILAFYFPGTVVRILIGDSGWQETHSGTLTLRATQSLTEGRKASIEQMWNEAQKRFPPQHQIAPQIIFAPTTELFRQLTTQPGWALASTQGTTIVLQAETIMRLHEKDTLLHEMLHILVEAESTTRAPLWLREGLVEVLASSHPDSTTPMPTAEINRVLLHADSQHTSERAHLAAAARVRILIAHYGMSTVRGWLSSGVPAGVE